MSDDGPKVTQINDINDLPEEIREQLQGQGQAPQVTYGAGPETEASCFEGDHHVFFFNPNTGGISIRSKQGADVGALSAHDLLSVAGMIVRDRIIMDLAQAKPADLIGMLGGRLLDGAARKAAGE